MKTLPNPFCFIETDENPDRFEHHFDEKEFMAAIEPGPLFIENPSPEYLKAVDLIPLLAVLAGH